MAITTETTEERPTCCAYAAGRMFYGMKNSVYFSQVMEGESVDFLNKCYQRNDPTAEQISDLVDTDGGVIQINEAVNIHMLKELGNGIIIYAENGVWYLSGPDTGFTATNYFRDKITDAGCVSAQSVVRVEDLHYYWSTEGIFKIAPNQFGNIQAINIAEESIQSFYNDISLKAKQKSTGSYNRIKKQVEWFYANGDQDQADDYKYAHNRSLLLDLRTEGFWPQSYNGTMEEGVTGSFLVGGINTNEAAVDSEIQYLTIVLGAPSATQNYSIDFSRKTDRAFEDFGADFPTAYLETGYESLAKPSNKKRAPYVTVHMRETEENWIDNGGNIELDFQSGCQMRAKWDWNDTDANGRWGNNQQIYRRNRLFIPPASPEPFDSGLRVITTKNKVLGRGKSMQLRFEQEAGKDMQILGWTNSWAVKVTM